MRKIYLAPAVQMNGSVVQETRMATGSGIEPTGFQKVGGSIGFDL
jgi:hypothetical protein